MNHSTIGVRILPPLSLSHSLSLAFVLLFSFSRSLARRPNGEHGESSRVRELHSLSPCGERKNHRQRRLNRLPLLGIMIIPVTHSPHILLSYHNHHYLSGLPSQFAYYLWGGRRGGVIIIFERWHTNKSTGALIFADNNRRDRCFRSTSWRFSLWKNKTSLPTKNSLGKKRCFENNRKNLSNPLMAVEL